MNELRIRGQVDEALNTLLKFELLPPGQWVCNEGFKTAWNHTCGFFLINFLTVPLSLHCCVQVFLCCGSWASPCGGSSCCGAWALGCRLSGCGTQA